MEKRLLRSRKDRMIAGVCGGLAEYFDVDPVFLRVAFVALAFLHGVGIVAYIILAVVTPEEGAETRRPAEIEEQNLSDTGDTSSEVGGDLRGYVGESDYVERRIRGRNFLALTLIVLGVLFLMSNLGLLWWFNFNVVWPLVLVVVGILLILGQIRR